MEGGDGIITLILGVVTILIGVTQFTSTRLPAFLHRSSIVTGAITGAVAIYDYLDVQRRIEDAKEQSELIAASVGAGIWTLIVGAVLAIVGGLLIRKLPRS
jgi:purine-cytosine permease-like protein